MQTLTVRQLADLWQTSQHTILQWINRGELRAMNISRTNRKGGGRPTWRITPDAIKEFELRQASSPPPDIRKSRRKTNKRSGPYPEH